MEGTIYTDYLKAAGLKRGVGEPVMPTEELKHKTWKIHGNGRQFSFPLPGRKFLVRNRIMGGGHSPISEALASMRT